MEALRKEITMSKTRIKWQKLSLIASSNAEVGNRSVKHFVHLHHERQQLLWIYITNNCFIKKHLRNIYVGSGAEKIFNSFIQPLFLANCMAHQNIELA